VPDVAALRMREATIVAGVWLTLGIGVLGELYVVLTWDRANRAELVVLFALAVLAAVFVWLLPRERLVRSRWREPFFLSWSFLDFAMLLVGTLADGGTASPLVLVFFIPVVFSSMSYPLGSVVAVGVVSVLSYLTLAILAGGSSGEFQGAFAAALVCTAAMSAWQASNHKRQHRALVTASRTDALTGCLNRRGFEERAVAQLEAMRRHRRTGAIVVLDVDNFKPVNDVFGHAAGDELLCWVAKTLEGAVRPSDAVGRIGGDEFAVFLSEVNGEQAQASAARIEAALNERAPASLGLASFPEDALELEDLTRRADVRLYASRRARNHGMAVAGADAPSLMGDANAAGDGAAPSRGFGPTDLLRATLDAMPRRADGSGRAPRTSLQDALLDQIDASVIVTDLGGMVLSWNSGAEDIFGWTSEEAVGRTTRDLVVPEDTKAAERLYENLIRDERWDGELLVRRKDRSPFTAYVRNRLIRDEDGNPSAIVGVAVDVSARVAAEGELLQSRNYAQAVTDCMGEGMFTLDAQGRITHLNPTAETLLGWRAQELRGRTVDTLLGTYRGEAATRSFPGSPMGRAMTETRAVSVEHELFRTAAARELPVAYTAAPFYTDAGLQGCVVIFHDISERLRREQERHRDAEALACLNRVEKALAEDRLVLHAQPILDLRSGQVVQHELLLRMCEPDKRLVPPEEFLPVAERYALIGEVDWWVIKQATSLAGGGCPVQANLSARSVCDLDVLEHIERCVQQCAVAPGLLVFEITETAILEDQQAAKTFAERVRALGCKLALDDFGTGYGSLTYLKQIPADFVKLDIEFVGDLVSSKASRNVVQAVVGLARDFGVQTVAEGVEDAETLELLARFGVDFAQGFHIAHPEPFAERPGDLSAPVSLQPPAVRRSVPRRPAPRQLTSAGRRRG
jgi:diguanylate cyclase (GGDEF)-like protein/PAS domain S-box-containing protein